MMAIGYTQPQSRATCRGAPAGRHLLFHPYHERLTKGVPDALLFAAACVSLKMETPGPFSGTRQDVEDYMDRYYGREIQPERMD